MKSVVYLLSSFFLFNCCTPAETEKSYTYLTIHRNNYIDTVKWDLSVDYLNETDSFFIFRGVENRRERSDSTTLYFPKFSETRDKYGFRLINSKTFTFEKQEFQVYKYISGESIGDGVTLSYFEPSIGMILHKSASWGTYLRLVKTEDTELDKIIFFLNDKIIANPSFFSPMNK